MNTFSIPASLRTFVMFLAVAASPFPSEAQSPVWLAHGAPSGACYHSDRAHSLAVATTLGSVTTKGVERVRSVVDVNEIDGTPEKQVASKHVATISYPLLGWIYLDDGGGRWFQAAPNARWTPALNTSVKAYLGLSVQPDAARDPVYVLSARRPAATSAGLYVTKCWERGAALLPGAVTR